MNLKEKKKKKIKPHKRPSLWEHMFKAILSETAPSLYLCSYLDQNPSASDPTLPAGTGNWSSCSACWKA